MFFFHTPSPSSSILPTCLYEVIISVPCFLVIDQLPWILLLLLEWRIPNLQPQGHILDPFRMPVPVPVATELTVSQIKLWLPPMDKQSLLLSFLFLIRETSSFLSSFQILCFLLFYLCFSFFQDSLNFIIFRPQYLYCCYYYQVHSHQSSFFSVHVILDIAARFILKFGIDFTVLFPYALQHLPSAYWFTYKILSLPSRLTIKWCLNSFSAQSPATFLLNSRHPPYDLQFLFDPSSVLFHCTHFSTEGPSQMQPL